MSKRTPNSNPYPNPSPMRPARMYTDHECIRMSGRGWPELGSAWRTIWRTIWRWKQPAERQLAEARAARCRHRPTLTPTLTLTLTRWGEAGYMRLLRSRNASCGIDLRHDLCFLLLWHACSEAMLAHMLFLCLCYHGAEANAHSNYGNTDCGSPHPPSTSGPATATAATVGPSGLESAGRAASSMTASSRSSSRLGDRWLLV